MSGLLDQFGKPLAFASFYDGANFNPGRTLLNKVATESRNTNTRYTRMDMLATARWMYANLGFAKGTVDDISMYSVGTGIGINSAAADRKIAEIYDGAWDAWKYVADFTGKFHLDVICDLISKAVDVDGDISSILTEDQSSQARIQMVEAHRLGMCGGDGFTDGVAFDSVGRPTTYRFSIDPEDTGKFQDVPARSVIHLFEPERSDEFRGKSGFHHAIPHLWDALDILSYEKAAVKEGSAIGLALHTKNPDGAPKFFGPQTAIMNATGATIGKTEQILGAGAIIRLGLNEELKSFMSNRPSPAFTGFLDFLDRDSAMGLGVPLDFLRGSKDAGGAAQRFILAKAQRKFDRRQALLIYFLKRIRFYWLAKEIKRGALPFTSDWHKVSIEPPAKITVDVGREAQQNRADIDSGIRTITEDVAERGGDFRRLRATLQVENDDLLKRAEELHKAHPDFSLETCLMLMRRSTPNGNLPLAQPTNFNAAQSS